MCDLSESSFYRESMRRLEVPGAKVADTGEAELMPELMLLQDAERSWPALLSPARSGGDVD